MSIPIKKMVAFSEKCPNSSSLTRRPTKFPKRIGFWAIARGNGPDLSRRYGMARLEGEFGESQISI
jgi:hypothetical protein